MIPFNRPYLSGRELDYIRAAVASGKISGNGIYTQKCHAYFRQKYNFTNCLLTTSCTDALEMAALLTDIRPGDEIIVPSYTFVSTANAFVLRGAKIVFADSRSDHPGIDEDSLESLISPLTKAIVPVHYAGVACDMDIITSLSKKYGLYVIEDAAQAIDNYYINHKGEKKFLGGIGHFGAFSFHETKNIISGEGGMLSVNDPQFNDRAEIIREKGTNRSAFFRGEVDKYNWVDIGSSFLPSEIIAAFLYAQLEQLALIQQKRKQIWQKYHTHLKTWSEEKGISQPCIPEYTGNNAHMYYLVLQDELQRSQFIDHLKQNNIMSVFHYQSLHNSPYYHNQYHGPELPHSVHYSKGLVRLPLFFELTDNETDYIIDIILKF